MDIKDLETFFNSCELPEQVVLDQCTTLIDPKLFVQTHLKALKSNPGNKTYLPYYDRLVKLYNKLNKL